MKQVLVRHGQVTVENVPPPLIEDRHILVEVRYSLISTGTEISNLENSRKSLVRRVLEQPNRVRQVMDYLRRQGIQKTVVKVKGQVAGVSPIGYSCSGVVIQVGKDVVGFHQGDKVACAGAGIANHAEIVIVPYNLAVRIPESCKLRDAASVSLGAIAMQGMRRADLRLGEIVAVIGLGLLGQLTVQLLKAAGCRVVGLDLDPRRVAMAQDSGADYVFDPSKADIKNEIRHLTNDHGVDATIITAASHGDSVVQQAMEMTRKKGRVVVVGAVGLGLKRSPLYEKELDFLISRSYGPGRYDEKYEEEGVDYPYEYVRWTENRNMVEYLHLIADGKIHLTKILEREYELNQAPQAYEELKAAHEKPLGVLLHYPINTEDSGMDKFVTKLAIRPHPANGKIRIAIIGAGSFAKSVHLPNIQKLANLYHLRAIVSGTGSHALVTAEHFRADYATTDYQDVLKDPDVDAVLISTRHNLHARQAILAAQANKAILLEKPMALNKRELDELTHVLKETGVPFMVGFNRRFSPAAKRMKQIIDGRRNPLMIMYRMNAGYLPHDHWTQNSEGGGRIIGEACHILDLFQYLIGTTVVDANVSAITPRTEHILASDNVSMTLRYKDGSVATLIYTALGSPDLNKEYMELYSDGKVMLMDDFRSLKIYGAPIRGWVAAAQDKGHWDELRNFASLIRDPVLYTNELDNLVETSRISLQLATGCLKSDNQPNDI